VRTADEMKQDEAKLWLPKSWSGLL